MDKILLIPLVSIFVTLSDSILNYKSAGYNFIGGEYTPVSSYYLFWLVVLISAILIIISMFSRKNGNSVIMALLISFFASIGYYLMGRKAISLSSYETVYLSFRPNYLYLINILSGLLMLVRNVIFLRTRKCINCNTDLNYPIDLKCPDCGYDNTFIKIIIAWILKYLIIFKNKNQLLGIIIIVLGIFASIPFFYSFYLYRARESNVLIPVLVILCILSLIISGIGYIIKNKILIRFVYVFIVLSMFNEIFKHYKTVFFAIYFVYSLILFLDLLYELFKNDNYAEFGIFSIVNSSVFVLLTIPCEYLNNNIASGILISGMSVMLFITGINMAKNKFSIVSIAVFIGIALMTYINSFIYCFIPGNYTMITQFFIIGYSIILLYYGFTGTQKEKYFPVSIGVINIITGLTSTMYIIMYIKRLNESFLSFPDILFWLAGADGCIFILYSLSAIIIIFSGISLIKNKEYGIKSGLAFCYMQISIFYILFPFLFLSRSMYTFHEFSGIIYPLILIMLIFLYFEKDKNMHKILSIPTEAVKPE